MCTEIDQSQIWGGEKSACVCVVNDVQINSKNSNDSVFAVDD